MISNYLRRIGEYFKERKVQCCLVMCLFTCTFFVYRDFDIRMLYGYVALGLILLVSFVQHIFAKIPPVITNFKTMSLVLCAVISLFSLMPCSNKNVDNFSLVISMLICIVFVIFSDPLENMNKPIAIMSVFGVLMAVFVLFFSIFEGLFWRSIYPLLSQIAKDYLDYYVPRGYSVSLGGCTYTDYIILLGMISISACLLFTDVSRKKAVVGWLSIIISAIAVVCVGRKGEMLALCATTTILLLVLSSPQQRKKRVILMVAVGLCVCFALIVFLPLLRNVEVLKRYVQMVDNLITGKDISSGRFELYALAWNKFMENPVFGIGWGQFANVIPEEFCHIHNGEGSQVIRDVHCIYLQFLCETGLVGFACIMFPICYCYIHTFKQMNRLQKEQIDTPVLIKCKLLNYISFSIQTFIFGIGLIDPSFQKVHFWCFYSIALIMQSAALSFENKLFANKVDREISKITHRIQRLFDYFCTRKRKA